MRQGDCIVKKLVIIGARAMARETCTYAREAGLEVKGFLDSKADALSGYEGYPTILSSVEDYEVQDEDVFVCALGEPEWKEKYVSIIRSKGGEFVNVVHPSAYIGQNVKIGVGCIICPRVTITNDIEIGNHVIVNINASLNHDGSYGDWTTVSPGCHIAGRCTIGKRVFLGVGTTIIPDVVLGDGVFVGAGAVVTKSFAFGKLLGVPARMS